MLLCAVIFLGLFLVWHLAARVTLKMFEDSWRYNHSGEFFFSHLIGGFLLLLMALIISAAWAISEAVCKALQTAIMGGL